MTFFLYKVTNLINGKIYYGVHNGNVDDSYLGSGSYILKAVKKYGKHNFVREVLETFNTKEEMYIREAEVVHMGMVLDPQTYNMAVGGRGGLHPDSLKKCIEANRGKKRSEESRKKMSDSAKVRKRQPLSEKTKEKIRISNIGKHQERLGAVTSEETKRKQSEAAKLALKRDPGLTLRRAASRTKYAKHLSEETKLKISISNTGKKRSPETKAKLKEKAIERERLKRLNRQRTSRSSS